MACVLAAAMLAAAAQDLAATVLAAAAMLAAALAAATASAQGAGGDSLLEPDDSETHESSLSLIRIFEVAYRSAPCRCGGGVLCKAPTVPIFVGSVFRVSAVAIASIGLEIRASA